MMPERSCYAIPERMTMVQAAAVEPLSIGVYAQRLARMRPGGQDRHPGFRTHWLVRVWLVSVP